MTSFASRAPSSNNARLPTLIGFAALVLLVLIGFAAPRAALHGWLIAFASVGFIPLGAFAWTMIHRLTGGKWGELAVPALTVAGSMLPMLFLFWLPLGIGSRLVYPWDADPSKAGEGVAAIYLNGGAIAVLMLVGLIGLDLLTRRANRRGLGQLGAGLALVFYTIFINFTAFGWLLSLEPRFTSSAFGAQVIVEQLLSALAFVALVQVDPEPRSAWKDIGALLLATTLGETYLILMTFIVVWYGDQPTQAAWYLRRTGHGWVWLEVAGIAIGSVGPLIALLFSKVRDHAGPLRVVAACLFVGVFAQAVWLVAPVTEAWSVATGIISVVAMVGLCWGMILPLRRLPGGSAAHGR